MTAAELRAALASYPDDATVVIAVEERREDDLPGDITDVREVELIPADGLYDVTEGDCLVLKIISPV